MRLQTIVATSTLFVVSVLAIGCQKTKINPNDATPPTVEIKVRGADGQYAVASTASLNIESTNQLDAMCTVNDPDGVSSISLTYSGTSDSCTLSGGAIFSGSFPIEGLPAPATQTLQADPSGQVLTSLPLLTQLKTPISCTVLGSPSQKGLPIGSKITLTCTGKNWSSDPQKSTATKVLTIDLK
jgi:hypothetical protein